MVSTPTPPITKVFVDSSVLIAAAISPKGSARELLLRSFAGQLVLFISLLVLEETERNLSRKAASALPAFQLLRDSLSENLVDPNKALILEVAASVEAKDAPIVGAAIHAKADYLATYDQEHLLSQKELIRSKFGLNVATPDQVLAQELGIQTEK